MPPPPRPNASAWKRRGRAWSRSAKSRRRPRLPKPPAKTTISLTLSGNHGAAKGERRLDHAQGFQAVAGAAHQHVAVVEHPSQDRLVDVDALDLVHVHLDGDAADESP